MTTSTSNSSLTETEDRLAILELIGRLVLVLDARDWDVLGQLFTDTVYSDRTSLLGGDPVTRRSRRLRRGMAPDAAEPRRSPPHDHLSRDHPRRRLET
jgi:hypothetical protein